MAPTAYGPGCFPSTEGPLYRRETSIYRIETTVNHVDKLNFILAPNSAPGSAPEQNVDCSTNLTINLPTGMSVDQVVNILKQLPLQSVKMTNRIESIVRDGMNAENAAESATEDESQNKCEQSQEVSEVISSLEDKTEQKMTEVLNQRVWKDEEDKVHVAFDLKVIKWTIMKPLCRLKTVIALIALFSSIATAIFVIFLYFIGRL